MRVVVALFCAIFGMAAFGPAAGAQAAFAPVTPAPDANTLKPGLAVVYFYDIYNYVAQMPTGDAAAKRGRPGPPIPMLNHRGRGSDVFDSGQATQVGMQITGLINLAKTGQ